jgi:hypothetical protein
VEQLCKLEEIPKIVMACRNDGEAYKEQTRLIDAYPEAKDKLFVTDVDIYCDL